MYEVVMDKIRITFKPLNLNDTFTLYLGSTKTNLILAHSPITTNDAYTPNYFTFYYTCPYTRSKESLFKFLEWEEFKKYYGVTEKYLNKDGEWVTPSIGMKIGDDIYFERSEVSKVTTSMIDFLIKYHVKENINQIVCFKHYKFPLTEILERLE